MSDHDQLANGLRKYASERNDPEGYVYDPPKGHPILKLPEEAKVYIADPPNEQTDRLIGYERRHIIPIAMMISPIFGVTPITDDIYRMAPEYAKNNLFCIVSRSGIIRDGAIINWEPIVVLVQKLCIVRIQCSLDPHKDEFIVKRALLWSKKTQNYEAVEDPQSDRINPRVLPTILDTYVRIEGIE